MLHERIGWLGRCALGGELLLEIFKPLATIFERALRGIERIGDGLHERHLGTQFALRLGDGGDATVDAVGERLELLFREAPFFSSKFRCKDERTSPRAAAMRRPGGCSGPP